MSWGQYYKTIFLQDLSDFPIKKRAKEIAKNQKKWLCDLSFDKKSFWKSDKSFGKNLSGNHTNLSGNPTKVL